MPWGCVGQSLLGASGPGTGGCGLPGTFTTISLMKPGVADAAFKSNPRASEVPDN